MFGVNHVISTESNPRLAAALDYAARGLPCFPCHSPNPVGFGSSAIGCSCRNGVECDDIGKHPRVSRGFHAATTDPAQIREWWRCWPGANVAIVPAGLLIADVDPRNGGGATLEGLEQAHGPFQREAVVLSGGGGLHLYFRYSGPPIPSGKDALGHGVDLKSHDGYVIAPPSFHKSLRQYRWLRRVMPAEVPIAPAWLISLARIGSGRINGSSRRSTTNDSAILTKDHPVGRRIAKLLHGRDCQTYWKISCPAHLDKHPSAAMYPRPNGRVFVRCFAGCSDAAVARAIMELAR